MVFQSFQARVALLADFTFEVSFAGVCWHVVVKSETCEELLAAALAFVPIILEMIFPFVYSESPSRFEYFVTHVARET